MGKSTQRENKAGLQGTLSRGGKTPRGPRKKWGGDNSPFIIDEFGSLIGLKDVKDIVLEIQAYSEIKQQRIFYGLQTDALTLHMIFKGNPGTGKTTVARLLGKTFHETGILSQGHIVEVERADLVGEYIGHTAQKTRSQIKKALGGILFIDEAYSLARGGQKDFGKEAIDVLVKAMEDYRDQFILILAGYLREMDYFLNMNPGLRSRFPMMIVFPDYTIDELMAIAESMAAEKEYLISSEAGYMLRKHLTRLSNKGHLKFSNARYIRNLLERATRKQAMRLVKENHYSRKKLMVLTPEDLSTGEQL